MHCGNVCVCDGFTRYTLGNFATGPPASEQAFGWKAFLIAASFFLFTLAAPFARGLVVLIGLFKTGDSRAYFMKLARQLGAYCGVDVLLLGWALLTLELPLLTGDIFTGPDDHLSWTVRDVVSANGVCYERCAANCALCAVACAMRCIACIRSQDLQMY